MLHVVFTPSGAGLLWQTLKGMGLHQRVLPLPDDLSTGPIASLDPADRLIWAESIWRPSDHRFSTLPPEFSEGWSSFPEDVKDFWSLALAEEACTVWMTRRVPMEYCGFLAFVEAAGEKDFRVVDMTDVVTTTDRRMAFSIDCVPPEEIDYADLIAKAAPLEARIRDENVDLWRRLRRENAPLRVLVDGDLVSAPITFFDDLLLSCTSANWQRAIRVEADASVSLWDDRAKQGNMPFLTSRLSALLEMGRIEARGDVGGDWMSVEIRLRDTAPSVLPADRSLE